VLKNAKYVWNVDESMLGWEAYSGFLSGKAIRHLRRNAV